MTFQAEKDPRFSRATDACSKTPPNHSIGMNSKATQLKFVCVALRMLLAFSQLAIQ